MALTRELMKGMGLTEEQISAIIAEHLNVKKDIEKQRDDVQKKLDDITKGTDWKAEHDKVKSEFDNYKTEVAGKERLAAKQRAFRKLLTAENIPDKFHDRIVKMTDFDAVEMDGDDIKDAQKQRDNIKAEWGEYVATIEKKGDNPANPPRDNDGGDGANPRAAERARLFYEHRYGPAPGDGAKDKQ